MNANASAQRAMSLERRREWRRRIWHISPGFLPFFLWLIPHEHPFDRRLTACVFVLAGVLTLVAFREYAWIARRCDGHRSRFAVVLGYAASVLIMLAVFPQHPELGLAVLAIIAFGDGMATVGGLLIGGPRVPWNPQKSVAGSCTFLLCSVPLATLVYWGEARPVVSLGQASACAGGAALVGAFVESWRGPLNDNIRVGAAAASAIMLLQKYFVGY